MSQLTRERLVTAALAGLLWASFFAGLIDRTNTSSTQSTHRRSREQGHSPADR